ncbi:MAG: ParM/StbA family protein (plasmid) [Phormidium sp.]
MGDGKLQTNLVCVFDGGTSIAKILFQVGGGEVQWMIMEPEHIALPAASAANLPNDSGMGKPEDNAWVRLNKTGECHAIGLVARNYKAIVSIKNLKCQSLVFKILAAIGAIAERSNLPDELELELGIMLPFGEYASRFDLSIDLKAALKSFYFRSRRLKVKLVDCLCVPEGFGAAKFTSSTKADYFHAGNTAQVMLGYRNTSCLFFRRGTLSSSESGTTTLGFYDLLDKVGAKVPGISKDDLGRSIYTLSENVFNRARLETKPVFKTEIAFHNLAVNRDASKAMLEVERIKQAYQTSLEEYWILLKNWLNESLPRDRELDAIVYSGGAVVLLEEKLKEYTASRNALYCTSGATEQVQKNLLVSKQDEKEFIAKNLAIRFADAWGFFVDFADYDLTKGKGAA